jgi:pimeloyl-ACP methyl ester carboxylesterase
MVRCPDKEDPMTTITERTTDAHAMRTAGEQPGNGAEARRRLLATMPVTERYLQLNGISTAVLEGGDGPPVVLLHGPGEHAPKWLRVIPGLVATCHVIAPDLPGHGESNAVQGSMDAEAMLSWLDALIACTCTAPPVLVGHISGGAIAARFASTRGERVARLVLVDMLGLQPFHPAPEFGLALQEYLAEPTSQTHDGLWKRCAFDLDALRKGLGERWEQIKAYNLDRMRIPQRHAALQAMMEQFGFPAIPPQVLERIAVPTTLIWGRHDIVTPLSAAEAASSRYGWPLQVIEGAADDPTMDQPTAFVAALRRVLDGNGRA